MYLLLEFAFTRPNFPQLWNAVLDFRLSLDIDNFSLWPPLSTDLRFGFLDHFMLSTIAIVCLRPSLDGHNSALSLVISNFQEAVGFKLNWISYFLVCSESMNPRKVHVIPITMIG